MPLITIYLLDSSDLSLGILYFVNSPDLVGIAVRGNALKGASSQYSRGFLFPSISAPDCRNSVTGRRMPLIYMDIRSVGFYSMAVSAHGLNSLIAIIPDVGSGLSFGLILKNACQYARATSPSTPSFDPAVSYESEAASSTLR